MLGTFLATYAIELACGGTFLTGFGVYSYFKLKGNKNKKFKVQYCDVTSVIREYKRLDKTLDDSVGGNKNEKFFGN